MVGDPGDRGQQSGPEGGIVQDDHRMRRGPVGEIRDDGAGPGQQLIQGRHLVCDAQPAEQRLVRVDPDPPRQLVAAHPATGHWRRLDPESGPPGGSPRIRRSARAARPRPRLGAPADRRHPAGAPASESGANGSPVAYRRSRAPDRHRRSSTARTSAALVQPVVFDSAI